MNKLREHFEAFWDHRKAKSFAECQEQEHAFDARNRGVHTVPLAKIVGSVGRYHDFDRQFRLRHHVSSDRFEHIKNLMKGGVNLPPVKLYQIKDEYYVLDGNHRVSAAKMLGHDDIEACIVEFLPSPTTLENIVYREKAEFLEKTQLPDTIKLTEIGQYDSLLQQIRTHQHFLEDYEQAPIDLNQAASDWYITIYQPLVRLIQKGKLLDAFPQRTPADLYTYISLQQWEHKQARTYSREIDQLIPDNVEDFRTMMAQKPEAEYPEMKREITIFILMTVSGKREYRVIDKLYALPEVREIHAVHGNVDIIVKAVLTRDLLSADAEVISYFVNDHIRQIPGIVNTQTLIPGLSKVK
jgi:DNA-binding Lrp family transcriptional regulator